MHSGTDTITSVASSCRRQQSNRRSGKDIAFQIQEDDLAEAYWHWLSEILSMLRGFLSFGLKRRVIFLWVGLFCLGW
jgi:hypothetical protein